MTDDERILREAVAAGPAPITTDLYGDRHFGGDYSRADLSKGQDRFVTACSPDRIARLLDEVERLRAELADQRGVMRDLLADAAQMKQRLGDAKLETARIRKELAEAKRDAQQCRADGRCQYAIDHGAEGAGACPPGECCMPPQQDEALEVLRRFVAAMDECTASAGYVKAWKVACGNRAAVIADARALIAKRGEK